MQALIVFSGKLVRFFLSIKQVLDLALCIFKNQGICFLSC